MRFIEYFTSGDGVDLWVTDLFAAPARVGYEAPSDVFSTEAPPRATRNW